MTPAQEKRLRDIRSRCATRRWAYRQRNHARGVWDRLRRVLADAEHAYVVSDDDVTRLRQAGVPEESAGHELQPPKAIFFLPAAEAERIDGRREVRVSLDAEVLVARGIVLVRF